MNHNEQRPNNPFTEIQEKLTAAINAVGDKYSEHFETMKHPITKHYYILANGNKFGLAFHSLDEKLPAEIKKECESEFNRVISENQL